MMLKKGKWDLPVCPFCIVSLYTMREKWTQLKAVMQRWSKSKYVRNPYLVTSAIFLLWMMFFDRHNMMAQWKERSKLSRLKEDQEYFIRENLSNKEKMEELMTDPEHLEKFAREQYLMKRENEDVFVIVDEK